MQYFTFIGLGGAKGYDDVKYSFENSSDDIEINKFVQVPIVKKYHHNITDVYIFATKVSKDRYEQELENQLKVYSVKPQFILIEADITFESFVKQLLNYIKENEHIILDITHSFRYLPTKLLFALRYIEIAKNVKINHLFYGKLSPRNKNGDFDEGIIIDLINDYNMQFISSVLSQFDKTLIISVDSIEQTANKDVLMKNFLESLFKFNQMIEYCEFDKCIKIVNKIIENCRSLEKNKEKYILVLPLVNNIRNKFREFELKRSNFDKYVELIEILLQHERYQLAITFTDQFFRSELIRATLEPKNLNFDIKLWLNKNVGFNKNKKILDASKFIYDFSQYLIINVYNLRPGNIYDNKLVELTLNKEENIDMNKKILSKYKNIINDFYSNIRNHINHGTSIEKKEKILETIKTMLDMLIKLGRSNNEI